MLLPYFLKTSPIYLCRIEGGKWGYINKTGEIVVDPDYDKAGPFINGKAEVVKGGKEIILKKEDIGE